MIHRRLGLVLLLLLSASCAATRVARPKPPPLYAPTGEDAELAGVRSDLGAIPGRLWDDTRLVFGNGRNLGILAGAVAYSFAQEHYLEEPEATFFDNHTLFGRTIQEGLGLLGNGGTLLAGTLAWYFIALARGDLESYEASKTVLSSITLTALVTTVAKTTVNDGRPGGGSHDFPSGHASVSMAVAASLDGLYGHTVGYPAYGLATLVGLQRLDTLKHDSGAVVAGMALGWVVGYTLAQHHAPRIFGMELGLALEPEIGGIGLSLSGGN